MIRWTEEEQRRIGNAIDSKLLGDPQSALLEAQKVLAVERRRTHGVVDPAGYVKKLLKLVKRGSVASGKHKPAIRPLERANKLCPLHQSMQDAVTTIKQVRAFANEVGGMERLKALVEAISS